MFGSDLYFTKLYYHINLEKSKANASDFIKHRLICFCYIINTIDQIKCFSWFPPVRFKELYWSFKSQTRILIENFQHYKRKKECEAIDVKKIIQFQDSKKPIILKISLKSQNKTITLHIVHRYIKNSYAVMFN